MCFSCWDAFWAWQRAARILFLTGLGKPSTVCSRGWCCRGLAGLRACSEVRSSLLTADPLLCQRALRSAAPSAALPALRFHYPAIMLIAHGHLCLLIRDLCQRLIVSFRLGLLRMSVLHAVPFCALTLISWVVSEAMGLTHQLIPGPQEHPLFYYLGTLQ